MSKKIGFVGLGTMGFPMAVNLLKAGFEVIGYDAFKGVYEKATAAGITMKDTLKEVASQADEAIISMVRDYAQNVDIIFGEDGLLAAKDKGKTIIVMSTLDPESMDELGKRVETESEFKLVSAAVSGGQSGAIAGTLSVMAAGKQDLIKNLQSYFDVIGSNTFYFGERPGNSQVAKLGNNMILGITINAVAEAMKFGDYYGLPQEEFIKLLKVSTGNSWVVQNWEEVSNWTAQTALSVLQKDLKNAYLEGEKYNIELPFDALASLHLFHAMGKEKPEEKH